MLEGDASVLEYFLSVECFAVTGRGAAVGDIFVQGALESSSPLNSTRQARENQELLSAVSKRVDLPCKHIAAAG